MRAALFAGTIGLCCAGLVACSDDAGDFVGDCNARILVGDDLFRPANGLHTPPRGRRLGTAPYVDCEGETAPGLGRARLFSVPGQDSATLVLSSEEEGDAVYINETVPWEERPQLIKHAGHYLTCSGPARFTGMWRYIEPEDMPSGEDHDSAKVPYTANFVTRHGSGVGLERWAQVTLQAEITTATRPVPSPELIERATAEGVPVTVTTVCEDGRFRVATIRTAPTT